MARYLRRQSLATITRDSFKDSIGDNEMFKSLSLVGGHFWANDSCRDHGHFALELRIKNNQVLSEHYYLITEKGKEIPVENELWLRPVGVCAVCGEEIIDEAMDAWFVGTFENSDYDAFEIALDEEHEGEVCIYCQESIENHGTWVQIYTKNGVYEAKYESGIVLDKGAINAFVDEMPYPLGEEEYDWKSLDETTWPWIVALSDGETVSRIDAWRAHYYSEPDNDVLVSLDIVDIRFDDRKFRKVHDAITAKFIEHEIPLIFTIHPTHNVCWSQGEYFVPAKFVDKAAKLVEEFKEDLNRGGWR